MNLIWFYLHCFTAVAILWADATDRLEPAFNAFEMSIGLYTPIDTADYEIPPYYISPLETDSTNMIPPSYWPPMESIESDSNLVKK